MARSPLFEEHSSLGARFTDFGGWEMPLQYQGVLAEHNAVRQGVGVFDVSHLGRVSIEGDDTTPLLRRLLCNDIADVAPGRAQYSMVLNEHGGVEDDVIVWRWAENRAWVLPNASNYDKVVGLLRSQATAGTVVEPLRESTALLAVQGPDAPGLLADVLEAAPGRFRLVETKGPSGTCWAAGTGYTGERGGEIAVASEHAPALWQALVAGGAVPCGLGARDTLRLEMGYPLWGQDLDPDTTPLEADLGWVVGWNHDFIGREALEKQQREGLSSRFDRVRDGGPCHSPARLPGACRGSKRGGGKRQLQPDAGPWDRAGFPVAAGGGRGRRDRSPWGVAPGSDMSSRPL